MRLSKSVTRRDEEDLDLKALWEALGEEPPIIENQSRRHAPRVPSSRRRQTLGTLSATQRISARSWSARAIVAPSSMHRPWSSRSSVTTTTGKFGASSRSATRWSSAVSGGRE